MESDGQDFDTALSEVLGLRATTPWVDKRAKALRMCSGNLSALAIQKMLGCRTRRTLWRFIHKINKGDYIGALCHKNFGKIKREYRGAYHYVYRAVVVLKRKTNSSIMQQEIQNCIRGPMPSKRTVRRWLEHCEFMCKQTRKVEAARARQNLPATPTMYTAAPSTANNPAP